MKLTAPEAMIATLFIGFLIFLLRAIPFIIFANRKPPAIFSFFEKFIPDISIAVLFLACIKSNTTDLLFNNPAPVAEIPSVICATVASIITALLHIWKRNAMLSIFGGTILYMVFNYFF